MDHTTIIKNRLTKNIKDPKIRGLIVQEYAYTFHELGLNENDSKNIAEKIIYFIETSPTLKDTEEKVKDLFNKTKVEDKNIFELIKLGLADRVNKIVTQISPHLKRITGKVFDYGMGAGEVTQKIKDELHLDIEGGDVRDFRSPNVSVPFVMLSDETNIGGKIVDVADKYYEAAILTNVIHHEKVNENILKELDRIVRRRLVIIETVPVGNSPEEIALDHERTFANDTLWNRFFNYADIPVPGTYETPQDWINRFESYGWKSIYSEDLGYDQKTIHDVHHLLVFER
jgi:hypothetical protein